MLCCICLLKAANMLDIFDVKGRQLKIAEIISKHFWIEPKYDNILTTQICTICWNKIDDFHEFYQSAERAHQEYQRLQENQNIIKEENLIKQENEDEKVFEDGLMQIEVEIEESQQNEGLIEIKNPLGDGQNELYDKESENEGNTSDDYEPSSGTSDDDGDDDNSCIDDKKSSEIKTKTIKKETTKRKRKSSDKSKKNEDTTKKKRKSHRLDPAVTDEMIKKHIQMACQLCVYVGKTFSDIVDHFKGHHAKTRPYIVCCDKKFTRSYVIAQHAIIHENPNSWSCNECNKSFKTSYGLRLHNISYHAPEEERMHACEYCSQKFGRKNLLELHRQSHIPKEEWTIICTQCTNRTAKFATQYLLNIHTSMYHRREANICHVCAKEIKDKKSFEKHVRSHFENSGPRLKCPIETCESYLKDEDNLKLHIQRYHVDDKTYKCPDCDKICPNRRSLSSHKHYFHSKEVFRCEHCDKTFKKAITLREHITQHTGETLYTCPFCTKTFNSSANMHSHKKKQHPAEWEEMRRKKNGILSNPS